MAEKRVVPQTLEVQQAVSQFPTDGSPAAVISLQETLSFNYPDRFRADTVGENYRRISIQTAQDRVVVVNGQVQTGPTDRWDAYKDLLLIKTRSALTAYLTQLGLDLDRTCLGRFEDDYCFVIGAQTLNAQTPQLWVQKDTFRPLRLILPPATMSNLEARLEIRFLDWAQVEGTMYPMMIQILRNHQLYREMRVENLQVDITQDPALFDTVGLRATLPPRVPDPVSAPAGLTLESATE